ncbi:MAG: transposase, partial [Alphaproteobacteria bacterium]|nr:transposase [Alphaproteobacteria bacterium]
KKNILADSITDFRAHLSLALSKYNSFRPHSSLRGATPLHYIHASFPALLQSHMY